MTIIKIRITTPKGQASATQKRLQPFLIGSKKKLVAFNTYINEDDSELYWEIETELRRAMKITRNAGMYKEMIQAVLGNKTVAKLIESPEQKQELTNMLNDQTKIEVLKEADANELVEYNKTFWQRIKDKWKKTKEPTDEE
jgi:4-hydroxy-3-methylbut-2-en-1-yl diphosphate synthase IspG/GcpE